MCIRDRLCGGVSVAKRAAEIIHDYPDVEEIIKQVNDSGIYQYQDDKYMIRLPERVEDIIKEGKILGHCIDTVSYTHLDVYKRQV